MCVSVIDCGTTNSRVYILDERGAIVHQQKRKIGVRDTAITGSRDALRKGLVAIFEDIFKERGIGEKDISYCVTGGMITSEIGLLEIPHLRAPVSVDQLAANVRVVSDRSVLPLDFPFIFVPGVKNDYPKTETLDSIRFMDFMRGEEIQCFGVLRNYSEIRPPYTIIVLSSHTKYIHVDAQERIAGSITTLSGQIYEALISSTSIGKSIRTDSLPPSEEAAKDSLKAAGTVVRDAGFLRALLMPRFMEVLLDTPPEQRKLFIEGAIIAEDLTAFKEYQQMFGTSGQPVVVIGEVGRCEIFQRMATILEIEVPDFTAITRETEIDALHIKGALEIAAKIRY